MYDYDVKTQLDLLNDCLDYWMDNLIFDSLVTKPCVVVGRTTPVTAVSPLTFVSPYEMSSYTDGVSLLRVVLTNKKKKSRAMDIIDPSTGEKVLL